MVLVIVFVILVVLAFVVAPVFVRPVAPGQRPVLTATSNSTDGGAVVALTGSSPTLDGCGHAGSSHSDGGYSDSGSCGH